MSSSFFAVWLGKVQNDTQRKKGFYSYADKKALVDNPSRSWQLQTKTCISGFACSSYVKSASAAGAEEIITMIQRPKWAMQQHVVEYGEHDKAQQKSWSSTASGLQMS